MELKTYFAQDEFGNSLPDATCYLYMRGTESLISGLQRANGVQLANPFAAESDGRIMFAAPNGTYDLRVSKANRDYRFSVQCNDVSEDVASAKSSAERAEVARDAAQLSAGVYPTVAAGLAAVINDKYFSVPSDSAQESLVLYHKVNNVAVEQSRYPSAKAVSDLLIDPQRPVSVTLEGADQELLVGLTDSNKNRTWMEARRQDGGPTTWAMTLLRAALGTLLGGFPGMLMAVTDANGRLTDLAVRDTDGQVPDFVIDRWAARIEPKLNFVAAKKPMYMVPDVRGTTSVLFGSDSYVRDGEVLPVLPNMTQWAGWGSSTIAQFSELTALAAEFGASYYNGGQGSESSTHGAARLGSVPALITVPSGVIPAAAGSVVTVSCSNVAAASYFRTTDGYLNGIKGQLKSTASTFTFTRSEAGEAVQTVGEKPFIPVDGPLHRADVTFLNLGKNDIQLNLPAEDVIKRIDASYDWLSPMVKRVIVIGQFSNVGTVAGSTNMTGLAQINAHCRQRYGRQFFDLGAYLAGSQVWTDTGISPTAEDLAQQALGNLPPSLSSDNVAHMNSTARAAVAKQLKAMIVGFGWY